jgi:TPR repeat protein
MKVNGLGLALLLLAAGSAQPVFSQNTQAEKHQFQAIKAQAERGDAQAQFILGNLYAFGSGTSRDLAKAAKWHRKAAEQGLATAQLRLGLDYLNGIGVKADPIEGTKWLHRSADQGSSEAEFELARSYAEGKGVGENPVEAARWYRRAADQHFAPAQFALGNCYFDGYGVSKDTTAGLGWMKQAAEQGYAPAENSYGMCFAKGKGVAQDYLQAYKWLNLSAAQGGENNTEAKINLSMAERAMTSAQIEQGQKLAREFKPNKPGSSVAPALAAQSPAASVPGVVSVKAGDESCEVYVDGALVGNAPSKVRLAPGMHVILVRKAGFKDYRRELKVTSGAELSLNASMEKQ